MQVPPTEIDIGETQEPFGAFYRREYPAIAAVAGTTCGDRMVGDDIAQDAFAQAYERWEDIARYDKPGAWVRRVAINAALNRRRRLGREARALLRLGRPDPVEVRHSDPMVWKAVDALTPRQRAVVFLHYREDRPVDEIASILELSVSTVTTHLHDARQRLAKSLGDDQ